MFVKNGMYKYISKNTRATNVLDQFICFLAMDNSSLMRSVDVTFRVNSGGLRVAPMAMDLFWYSIPDGREILADP